MEPSYLLTPLAIAALGGGNPLMALGLLGIIEAFHVFAVLVVISILLGITKNPANNLLKSTIIFSFFIGILTDIYTIIAPFYLEVRDPNLDSYDPSILLHNNLVLVSGVAIIIIFFLIIFCFINKIKKSFIIIFATTIILLPWPQILLSNSYHQGDPRLASAKETAEFTNQIQYSIVNESIEKNPQDPKHNMLVLKAGINSPGTKQAMYHFDFYFKPLSGAYIKPNYERPMEIYINSQKYSYNQSSIGFDLDLKPGDNTITFAVPYVYYDNKNTELLNLLPADDTKHVYGLYEFSLTISSIRITTKEPSARTMGEYIKIPANKELGRYTTKQYNYEVFYNQ